MPLIEPIEQLIQSDFSLLLLGKMDIENIRVAKGQIGPETPGYHIGPSSGTLDFTFTPGIFKRKYSISEMMTFSERGFTLVSIKGGNIYAIHSSPETLPKELEYQEVSRDKYIERFGELYPR